VRPDAQNGLIIGAIAGAATLVLNLLNVALITGTGCHQQGSFLPLVAFAIFVILAGVAGSRAERAGGSGAIAGAVTGAVSGVAMPILVLFTTISAAPVCAGTSQIDLIALTSIGGVLGLVIFLAGIPVGAGAGALGALFGGPAESAGGV
jgi:hypothetical protein